MRLIGDQFVETCFRVNAGRRMIFRTAATLEFYRVRGFIVATAAPRRLAYRARSRMASRHQIINRSRDCCLFWTGLGRWCVSWLQ